MSRMNTIGSASHMEKLGVIHGQRDEIERLRAINAELLAALEWIAEDGGVCARAAECARAAIANAKGE